MKIETVKESFKVVWVLPTFWDSCDFPELNSLPKNEINVVRGLTVCKWRCCWKKLNWTCFRYQRTSQWFFILLKPCSFPEWKCLPILNRSLSQVYCLQVKMLLKEVRLDLFPLPKDLPGCNGFTFCWNSCDPCSFTELNPSSR